MASVRGGGGGDDDYDDGDNDAQTADNDRPARDLTWICLVNTPSQQSSVR